MNHKNKGLCWKVGQRRVPVGMNRKAQGAYHAEMKLTGVGVENAAAISLFRNKN